MVECIYILKDTHGDEYAYRGKTAAYEDGLACIGLPIPIIHDLIMRLNDEDIEEMLDTWLENYDSKVYYVEFARERE